MGFAPIPSQSHCGMLLLHHDRDLVLFWNWRLMPVTLRLDLFDRQAGCYYINEALKLVLLEGTAPSSSV